MNEPNNEVEEEIRRQMAANSTSYNRMSPPQPEPSKLHKMQSRGGITGAIATFLLLFLKLGAPLFAILGKLKFLAFLPKIFITFGSMFVSMWAYSMMFGWPFAMGFVILIFIHECGHAFAAISLGIPIKGMLFVPFMGAVVATRGGRNVVENAFIGIMGPVVGSTACLLCASMYFVFGSPFWLALGYTGLFINLFNLAPTVPLDGGWITPIFSAKLLAFGVIVLFVLLPLNPLMWVLAIMSIPRIKAHWKAKPDDPYFQAKKSDRIKYGIAYLGLVAILFFSMKTIKSMIPNLSRQSTTVAFNVQKGVSRL